MAPVLQYFRALRVTSVTSLTNKQKKNNFLKSFLLRLQYIVSRACASSLLCTSFASSPASLWPNWTRRLTTNQKIGGSSPSRDIFVLRSARVWRCCRRRSVCAAWMPERSKGADLRSAGRKSAWVRTPLQANFCSSARSARSRLRYAVEVLSGKPPWPNG